MTRRRRLRRRSRQGLTLLETAALTSVAAVVVAAFVPAFLREIRMSKVSEAPEQLAQLHRGAAAYYASRHVVPGQPGRMGQCVPEPAGPAPASPSESPERYDFGAEDTPGHATFTALGFAPERPVRYRYSVLVSPQPGCGPREPGEPVELGFVAEGDLDGDGTLSRFERRANNAENPDELTPAGPLRVQRRVE